MLTERKKRNKKHSFLLLFTAVTACVVAVPPLAGLEVAVGIHAGGAPRLPALGVAERAHLVGLALVDEGEDAVTAGKGGAVTH